MATRKPLFFGDYGSEEMAATDDIQLGGLDMSGDITTNGNEVTGLPSVPSGDTAAASKIYVDNVAREARPKESVKAATTGALPSYTASGSGVGKTLTAVANGAWNSSDSDGVALTAGTVETGDRLLVKDEGSGTSVENGIYVLTQQGDVGNPWVLTRALDFNEDNEVVAGAYSWVSEGTTLDNTTWTVITNNPITVDTTPITFTQTQGPGTYSAGDGIEISGAGVIAVDLAATNPCLEFDASSPGDLQLQINGSTLEKTGTGARVKGLPSLFEINSVATNATVDAAALNVLTAGPASDADGEHTHPSLGSSDTLSGTATASESLNQGDPIEWGGAADQIRQARANANDRVDCIGVVIESGGISAAGSGAVVYQGLAEDVLSGATVGDRYYVDNAGGLVQGFGSISAGNHVIVVGTAKNADDLWVQPQYITKKAA